MKGYMKSEIMFDRETKQFFIGYEKVCCTETIYKRIKVHQVKWFDTYGDALVRLTELQQGAGRKH